METLNKLHKDKLLEQKKNDKKLRRQLSSTYKLQSASQQEIASLQQQIYKLNQQIQQKENNEQIK